MAEPISFSTAAQHLRLGDDVSEQALVESYIKAARVWVENYTGHILVQRPMTQTFDRFTRFLELTKRPIVTVDEIAYTDTDGAAATYIGYVITEGHYPLRVFPAYNGWWPSIRTNTPITVTFTAGYSAAELVSEDVQPLLQAMLLLTGWWFEQRSTANVGNIVTEVPLAAVALCDQFRTPGL